FPRNDRPYGLKRAAFQTEIALWHNGALPSFLFPAQPAAGKTIQKFSPAQPGDGYSWNVVCVPVPAHPPE
ncbi:MAG: hypothetical protein MSH25_08185, partial [Desulfovibrio sp.]|uniref:hypothetical protein n=1 Tax=Desulfovibrio sp. TaxID=885 RepID=UPI0025B966C7